jgi:hypothetical protein
MTHEGTGSLRSMATVLVGAPRCRTMLGGRRLRDAGRPALTRGGWLKGGNLGELHLTARTSMTTLDDVSAENRPPGTAASDRGRSSTGVTPRVIQSAISAWLSDGTGGFRVVMDLRFFPKPISPQTHEPFQASDRSRGQRRAEPSGKKARMEVRPCPGASDVMVNGPDDGYVERKGRTGKVCGARPRQCDGDVSECSHMSPEAASIEGDLQVS